MDLTHYIQKILSDVSLIKSISEAEIKKGYLEEYYFNKLIDCIKENIEYEIYFMELLDYVDIKSYSMGIVDKMIRENVGIDKISHLHLDDRQMQKLACVSGDAYMLYLKKLYTESKHSESELCKYFSDNYSDSGYEYLCILNGSSYEKCSIIDYIADNMSRKGSINTLVCKRAKARTLRYERDNEKLLQYVKENEYIYDLEIAENIFASEDILRGLIEIKGLKYCKEIKRRAASTLQKKRIVKNG